MVDMPIELVKYFQMLQRSIMPLYSWSFMDC